MKLRWLVQHTALICAVLLSGCAGKQSVLNPQSGAAHNLFGLFSFFTVVCAVIWVLVVLALAIVLVRQRRVVAASLADSPRQQRIKTTVVAGLVAVTVIILAIFTLTSFYATRGITQPGADKPLLIKVTGQQWWWEVEYEDPDPSKTFTTANEIHIPVGRPVAIQLNATDVIHSFWVPNLMGKQDLIPGRTNGLTLTTDHPGTYRGQCAEFCGLQHAHMAFIVVAQPQDQFDAWRTHQLQPATQPTDPVQAHGQELVVEGKCATCHAIVGTHAGAHTAPDLTHFGGQSTIAAGLLPNTPDNLSRWIADPQGLKPGTNMPKVPLSDADRAAVVAYLEGLK